MTRPFYCSKAAGRDIAEVCFAKGRMTERSLLARIWISHCEETALKCMYKALRAVVICELQL